MYSKESDSWSKAATAQSGLMGVFWYKGSNSEHRGLHKWKHNSLEIQIRLLLGISSYELVLSVHTTKLIRSQNPKQMPEYREEMKNCA